MWFIVRRDKRKKRENERRKKFKKASFVSPCRVTRKERILKFTMTWVNLKAQGILSNDKFGILVFLYLRLAMQAMHVLLYNDDSH